MIGSIGTTSIVLIHIDTLLDMIRAYIWFLKSIRSVFNKKSKEIRFERVTAVNKTLILNRRPF